MKTTIRMAMIVTSVVLGGCVGGEPPLEDTNTDEAIEEAEQDLMKGPMCCDSCDDNGGIGPLLCSGCGPCSDP